MTRKPKTFHATRASLTAQGATRQEAKANLEKAIDWALDDHRPFIEFRFGCALFASAGPNGWQSSVTFPEDQKHGSARGATCFYGQVDRASVVAAIRQHAASATWTPDCDDADYASKSGLDDAGQRELIRGFAWQRRAQAALADGATINEAHSIACGLTA